MKNDLLEIVFILDRSGSMSSIKKDTEGGFDAFIESQKKVPGEVKVSLYQFDTLYEPVYIGVPLEEVKPLKLVPRGGTALLDAIGKTIDDLGKKYQDLPEDQRPGKVIVVIMTDGEENSSKEFSNKIITEKIKHQEEKYNWDFVYIGANQDAIAVAKTIGVSAESALTYAASHLGTTTAYDSLDKSILKTRSYQAKGIFSKSVFTEEDKKKQDDLTK